MKKQKNLIGKISIVISLAALFFAATYFGESANYTDCLLFIIGLLLGMSLLEADEIFLFKYYTDNEFLESGQQKKLVTRSLLFLLLLFPLGLFLLTSTGSVIGVGMFLSILSGLALEFFILRNDRTGFQERFLHQLKREITAEEQLILITVFISVTVLYGFLVIFLGR